MYTVGKKIEAFSIPILKSLLQDLRQKEIWDLILHNRGAKSCGDTKQISFQEKILPSLSFSMLTICNLLGTSRKKRKVTAVYWVLGVFPALLSFF